MPSQSSGSTSVPQKPNPLGSWDTKRQESYRKSGALPNLYFLLDESSSMYGEVAALCAAYNGLLNAMRREMVSPLSTLECWAFSEQSRKLYEGPLLHAPLLTAKEYQPSGGTHLKPNIAHVLQHTTGAGQKILIVFTDGLDNVADNGGDLASGKPSPSPWSTDAIRALMATKQAEGWLCIYLGAFPKALKQGLACGFLEGNCLVFEKAALAQAFQVLREGMQRFFTTSGGARSKLLESGIFS